MSAMMAMLMAMLPNVFMAIVAKLVTQSFMQAVLEKVLIAGLQKAAALTTNTVDDDLVKLVADRLTDNGEAKKNE